MEAHARLFPRRVRLAHLALVAHAEEASPDGWPTPAMVAQFARLYQFTITVRQNLRGRAGQLVCRGDVTDRTMQTMMVLVGYVGRHQALGLVEI